MRLICPNCGAQYEVPKNVIPQGGRDVQCSNCANTWYQNHPDEDPILADELGQPAIGSEEMAADVEPDRDPVPDPAPAPRSTAAADPKPTAPDAAPIPVATPVPAKDPVSSKDPESLKDPVPAADPQRQRGLDPAVADVLREEAARETRKRASEGGTLESQPDLGLEEPNDDEAARRSREARARMARMRGETTPSDPAANTVAVAVASVTDPSISASRGGLLPDIEEINQTLRSSSERRDVETAQGRAELYDDDEPGSFGRGFRTMIIIAALAIALYVFAPQIAAWIPALDPVLSGYVDGVNAMRGWLDGKITALLSGLDGLSSEATPDTPEP